MSRRFPALGRAVFLAALFSFGAASAWAGPWSYAKTDRFEVLSNAPTSSARLLVARLAEFRECYHLVFPGRPFHEPKVRIVIFEHEKELLSYMPLYRGKMLENFAGVFCGFADEAVIAITVQQDMRGTLQVIFHEYVHLLMHAQGYNLPPWLNEGTAELLSTLSVDRGKLRVGASQPWHVALLRERKMMPSTACLRSLWARPSTTKRLAEGSSTRRRGPWSITGTPA